MLKGSQVVGNWAETGKIKSTKHAYASYRAQHQQLMADDSIVVENDLGWLRPLANLSLLIFLAPAVTLWGERVMSVSGLGVAQGPSRMKSS